MAARKRSPIHPIIGLDEAVGLVEKLYQADRNHPVDREVAANNLGYSGLTGRSMGILSTLRQYGLVDTVGDGQIAVSDLAVALLYPESEAEALRLRREAAQLPKIFSEILERYNRLIPSDANLMSYLVRLGFFESAALNVIKSLKATYEFAKLGDELEEAVEASEEIEEDIEISSIEPTSSPAEGFFNRTANSGGVEDAATVERTDVFTVDEGSITVSWPAKMSAESYQDIEDWIEILLRKMKRAVE